MWLRFLHAIGLTNLSKREVDAYEAMTRSSVRPSVDGGVAQSQARPPSTESITSAALTAHPEPDKLRLKPPSTADPLARTQETVDEALRLLQTRSYAKAQRIIEDHLKLGIDGADLHYYRALAMLRGRRPRTLTVAEIKPIETSAQRAIEAADFAAHHLGLLALIRHDFYQGNHLALPRTTCEELLMRAAEAPRDPARWDELIDHLSWAKPISLDREGEELPEASARPAPGR
jgi:hypothetical protein